MTDAPWITATTGAGSFRTEVQAAGHLVVADEPAGSGGANDGPSPYDLLLAAIGSCTAMTVRMYAARKQWPLDEVVVRLRNERKHAEDCANCETKRVGIKRIERQIELRGELSEEQRQRLLEIADRCPVKQTLERGIEIVTSH
jgi:putative redox protein